MTPNDELFSGIDKLIQGVPTQKKHLSKGLVQLEKAPNPIIFFEDPKFLAGPELYPWQYEVLRDFYELLCPYCNDIEKIHNEPIPLNMDEFRYYRITQTLFEYDHCPKCGLYKFDMPDDLKFYNELIGVVGMRSGKGVLIAGAVAWNLHECLCIEDFQSKLGVVKNQEIDGAFVAASGQQASETVWGHFNGFYSESPWFQNYKKALMNLEITDPRFHRGDLYREADRSIYWRDKNIRVRTFTSNSGSSAGKTRIFSVIDELSRLDAGESKYSATEVYRVFQRSLLTLKASVNKLRATGVYDIPDAKMYCISSPLFADDKSMQLLGQASQRQKLFAFKRSTWEANPTITQEDLADEFEADPVGAERDYGANPPGAENPFLKDSRMLELCIDSKRPSMFNPREIFFEQLIQGIRFHYVTLDIGQIKFNNLTEYFIHCDPGKSQDSFCVAMGHYEDRVTVIDGALEYRPISKENKLGMPPHIVHFPSVTDMIIRLSETLSLKVVTYDRWNSEEQIQRLRDKGILAIGKNINRDDHTKFLRNMEGGLVRFPRREVDDLNPKPIRNVPCAKALWELVRLNDNGMRVDHPTGGSSDMIQCYIGVHRVIATPELIFSNAELKNQQRVQQIRQQRNHDRACGRVVRVRR